MPPIPDKPRTEDSTTFSPNAFFTAWSKEELTAPYDGDFRKFICRAFGLPPTDIYGYKGGPAEVTLLQAQTYVEFGGMGRLHEWYKDDEGKQVSCRSRNRYTRDLTDGVKLAFSAQLRLLQKSPRTLTSSRLQRTRRML